jgi:hypothetical protein
MKSYRIFLASSYELRQDRLEFAAFVLNYNKELKKYNIQLELEWWEDMDDHVNNDRKQNDYNEALKASHFLVMLFWRKVGKFTREEFELGRKLYADKGLPYVYCYEKPCTDAETQDSKKEFLASLNQDGKEQFQTPYTEIGRVTELFRKNFQRLLDDNTIIQPNTQPATLLSPKGPAEPTVFLGREEELKVIRQRLDKGGKLLLINAEGGIGKVRLPSRPSTGTKASTTTNTTLGYFVPMALPMP